MTGDSSLKACQTWFTATKAVKNVTDETGLITLCASCAHNNTAAYVLSIRIQHAQASEQAEELCVKPPRVGVTVVLWSALPPIACGIRCRLVGHCQQRIPVTCIPIQILLCNVEQTRFSRSASKTYQLVVSMAKRHCICSCIGRYSDSSLHRRSAHWAKCELTWENTVRVGRETTGSIDSSSSCNDVSQQRF